jgi:twitching motility protein PilT
MTAGAPGPREPERPAPERPAPRELKFAEALKYAREARATDLHILGGDPIRVRRARRIVAVQQAVVPASEVARYVAAVRERDQAADDQLDRLGACNVRELDETGASLRVHISFESRGTRIHVRLTQERPPEFAKLNRPPNMIEWTKNDSGMIVISGPKGSGKTTALHALANAINNEGGRSITIIETPKEYEHPQGAGSFVEQLEVGHGRHIKSAAQGVISSMDGDRDVILIGQITSYDEAKAALAAAEKGLLVILTIHGRNTVQALEGLVGWFPIEEQERARMLVANNLLGAVNFRLLTKVGGGDFPISEVLAGDDQVRNLLRGGKFDDIRQRHMETARARGTKTLEAALMEAVKKGDININDARRTAVYPDQVQQ